MYQFKRLFLFIAVLLSLVLVTSGLGICAEDESGAESFTTRVVNFKVFIGPEKSICCNIIANLHRPVSATSENPVPALMATNGFGGSKDDAYETGVNNELMQFARHGYVGLTFSCLGFGGSDGLISMNDQDYDGAVASQLAQFLGGKEGIAFEEYSYVDGEQIWSKPVAAVDFVVRDDAKSGIDYDPRVGMIGASYGGAIVYAAAAYDQRFDTIVPQETWTSLLYSLTPNNADLDEDLMTPALGVAKIAWSEAFFFAGLTQPLINRDVYRPETTCPGFREEACPVITDGMKYGYPNDIGLDLNPTVSSLFYTDKINIPVFINQGVNDSLFNLKEGIALYTRLKERGVPVKMMWMSWGHGGGNCLDPFPPGPPCAGSPVPGELDATMPIEDSYQGQLYLDWFDHWLKDKPVSTGAEFSYFREWIPEVTDGPNGAQYTHADAYPVGSPTTFYLSGCGKLVKTEKEIRKGWAKLKTSTKARTSYSELSAIDRSQPIYDKRGTFMAFTSEPLTSDMDVVGTPVLEVTFTAPEFLKTQEDGPEGQLILFAKIYDVGPDGTEELPFRLVSPVRILDVSQPVKISLPTLAYRFEAGHSLRLVLAQGDMSYAANSVEAKVKIVNGYKNVHSLTLPVVAAE